MNPIRLRTRSAPRRFRSLRAGLLPLCVLAATACQTRFYPMPSSSMEPTIRPGERLKIDKTAYRARLPERGEVVALKPPQHPERLWILRIVGLPGERITTADGQLFADGVPLGIPWQPLTKGSARFALHQPELPLRVPHGEYFLLGDNAREANDSRVWGTVRFSCILGQVVAREDEAPDRFSRPAGTSGRSR